MNPRIGPDREEKFKVIGTGAAILGASAITAAAGYFGSRGQKSSTSRVSATLGSKDLRGTGESYRDMTKDYVESEPGFTSGEKGAYKKLQDRAITGQARGERMRAKAYGASAGVRGPGMMGMMDRIAEGERESRYMANLNFFQVQHAVRESDTARRAAVAAQFLWPAESARGAGQVSSIETNNPDAWLNAIGMGAAFYGQASTGFPTPGTSTARGTGTGPTYSIGSQRSATQKA